MIAGFNNIKDDIKDVRKEIQDLNNMYFQQFSKTEDELKNQKVKLVENKLN